MIPYKTIDKKMNAVIKEMNKLGLITTHCCEGHEKDLAYISIDIKKSKIVDIAIRDGKRLVFWWNRKGTKKKYTTNWT